MTDRQTGRAGLADAPKEPSPRDAAGGTTGPVQHARVAGRRDEGEPGARAERRAYVRQIDCSPCTPREPDRGGRHR